MRPYIPFENVCKVELIFSIGGQRCENVIHFHNTAGSFGVVEMGLLAYNLVAWYGYSVAPQMSDELSLVLLRLTNLTTESSPAFDYTAELPVVGAQTGAPNPNNAALVTKFTTELRGRSYRGRVFNMGWPSVNNATPTTATGPATTFNTAWTAMAAGLPGDWEHVVASYYHNGAWRTVGVATPVIGYVTNPEIDSQRRRLAGRGT